MLTESIRGVPHAYDFIHAQKHARLADPSVGAQSLVFIHGWLLSRTYWQPLVQTLSADYSCLTYDMRGFGESTLTSRQLDSRRLEKPIEGSLQNDLIQPIELPADRTLMDPNSGQQIETYQASAHGLAAYAKDLEALLNQLGLDDVWLVGHSLGGSIALWAAYLLPERVRGVVCINAGGGIYIEKEFEKFRAAGQQMLKFRPSWLTRLPLLPRIFSRLMVEQPLPIRWGQQRLRDFIRADAQAAKGSLLESTTLEEVYLLPQLVSQIRQPVHFITATEDTIMPPRYVQYLASFHSGFESGEIVSKISNCGHMAMVEQPEAVAQIIESILETDRSSEPIA